MTVPADRPVPPALGELPIADPSVALTFARFTGSAGPVTLLVSRYAGGLLHGTVVTDPAGAPFPDPLAAWTALGHDRLLEAATRPAAMTVAAADALPPVATGAHHVAIGTNYAEHGAETQVAGSFLFPKVVQPTGARSAVSSEGLLDHEVELGLVPLTDLGPDAQPAVMGLLLANDLTDRDLLLRLADASDIHSGRGFTTAKSRPGYLPLGDLLVVPRDWRAYVQGLQLELFVDGTRRQSGAPAEMLWDADRILAKVLAASTREFAHEGHSVALTPRPGVIDAGTIVLTGTPSGVVFRTADLLQAVAEEMRETGTTGPPGAAQLLAGGERYLREAAADHRYLQPGQQVVARATGLGQIVVDVV